MKHLTTGLLLATVVAGALVTGAQAQTPAPKMGGGKMMPGKMMAGKMSGQVYMCSDGMCYMTPADAKKVGYKDPMGSGMMKKAAMAPKGGKRITAEAAMKMSRMDHSKMDHSKMAPGKMGKGM